MKVAAIQMVSGVEIEPNLRTARRLLSEAAAAGVELAVLPEYFCTVGRRDTDKLALQEPLGSGPIQDWLAATAHELGLWIVGGTLPLAAGVEGKCHNACLVFSPTGQRVAHYNKMHLFHFDDGERRYDEAVVLVAGDTPVHFDLPSRDGHRWRIGLSVCYDLRFPELYRAYAQAGADLLVVPSAFTWLTGQAHWEVLLRARAIENLSGVIAAAQGGTHENGRRTWGRSMVIDPWGQVLAMHPEGEAVVSARLDPVVLRGRRAQLPALEHRRRF